MYSVVAPLVLIRLGLAWVFVAFFVSDSFLLVVFFAALFINCLRLLRL